MRGAIAACHRERSEAESKDPVKSSIGLNRGLKAWTRARGVRR
jgi:hypothetical protein